MAKLKNTSQLLTEIDAIREQTRREIGDMEQTIEALTTAANRLNSRDLRGAIASIEAARKITIRGEKREKVIEKFERIVESEIAVEA